MLRRLRDDEGSSPVEFVLVGALLTALTLGVVQLAVVLYVRNVVHDAAVAGAFHASLADVAPAEGAARASDIVATALGGDFVDGATAAEIVIDGRGYVEVTLVVTVPLIGLIGPSAGWEVTARAPVARFDDP